VKWRGVLLLLLTLSIAKMKTQDNIIKLKNAYLNQSGGNAGAGRDDGLETSVVYYEVAN
jgi:hypothetical protein